MCEGKVLMDIDSFQERDIGKSNFMSNDANITLSLGKSELYVTTFTNWKESFTANSFTVIGAMTGTRNLARL